MSSYHEEEALGRAYDGRLMRRLMQFVRPCRGLLALSAVLLLCARGADIVQPYLLKLAIDGPIARGSLAGLTRVSLLYIGALVAEFLFSYAQLYVLNLAGQRVMFDLRLAIFGHVQRLPVQYFDRNPVGRLFTRVTSDVENLHEMLTSGLVAVFGDLVMAGGILVAMLVLDLRLSLVTFTIFPVLLLASALYRRHAREAYREVRAKQAKLNATLQEHLAGMRIVQLFVREAESFRRFDAINREHRAANLRALHTYAIFYPAVEVIASAALALILWYGGGGVLAGGLSLGGLVAFLESGSSNSWTRPRSRARPGPARAGRLRAVWAGRSSSATSGSPTNRASPCCAMYPLRCGPANASHWWGPRAPARRRW
jgi:ATP-binding cassette subfamily B protein